MTQKITPFLWFDTQAEEAANSYVSTFPNSDVLRTTRHGEAGPGAAGTVMTVSFRLAGQEFTALNGGPHFSFTEAVSFDIECETQDEIDRYREALAAGGEKGPCGWLKDRFGLSWQVVPRVLNEMVRNPDPERANRVMTAMLQMGKMDSAKLRQAHDHS